MQYFKYLFLFMLFSAFLFAQAESFIVGFAQDTLGNDWRKAQVKELEDAFKAYPEVKFFYTDAKGDTARQITDIEKMIVQKVDVLITSPRDAKAMDGVITKAYKSGIPVVLLSRKIESDNYTVFIRADNLEIGRKSAEFIANRLDGKGGVFILQHTPTTTPAQERTKGFLDEIAKYKAIKITGIKVANSLRAEAIMQTEAALKEGILFDAIYAQSDSMAAGARMALSKAGIDPKNIVTTGVDYIKEAQEAILSGEQSASFTYPTAGREGALAAIKILKKEPLEKEMILKSIMVTKDNAKQVEPIF